MRPMSDINIGDVYTIGWPHTLEWVVLEKDNKEKVVQVQAINYRGPSNLNYPIWKKNTDRLFNRRVLKGRTEITP